MGVKDIIGTLASRFSDKTTQTLVTAADATSSLKSITENVISGNANTKTSELAQAISAASLLATGVTAMSSAANSKGPSAYGYYVAGVSMQLNLALASASMVLATAYFKEGNISAGIATTFSAVSAASNAVGTAASLAPGVNSVEVTATAGGSIFSFASVIISNYADHISRELVDAAEKLREDTNKLKEQLRQQDPFNPSNMLASLLPWTHSPYNKSAKYRIVDPLALDLDGNGIRTVAAYQFSGSLFDHDGDGIRTASGWVGKEDGLLVYDRNGDGIINNGSELFGDATRLKNGGTAAHGFAALADLDDNGDGKIDAADQAFPSLRVWRDLNQDGISRPRCSRSAPHSATPTAAWATATRWRRKAATPPLTAKPARWAICCWPTIRCSAASTIM